VSASTTVVVQLIHTFKHVWLLLLLLLPQTAAGCLLQSGNSVDVPVYDFSTHARSAETRRVSMARICRAAQQTVLQQLLFVCSKVYWVLLCMLQSIWLQC
jgi:hypothetical protein